MPLGSIHTILFYGRAAMAAIGQVDVESSADFDNYSIIEEQGQVVVLSEARADKIRYFYSQDQVEVLTEALSKVYADISAVGDVGFSPSSFDNAQAVWNMSLSGITNPESAGAILNEIKTLIMNLDNNPTQGELRDGFAARAPFPVPDWFVPNIYTRPAVWETPDYRYGDKESPRYNSQYELYDYETGVWNDEEAAREGVTIDEAFRAEVNEYVINYKDYLHDDYLWQRHYEQERVSQWPYYWADKVLLQKDHPYNS